MSNRDELGRMNVGQYFRFAQFEAHRIRRHIWSLRKIGEQRCRFGSLSEIEADLRHCLECGNLPARSAGSFA